MDSLGFTSLIRDVVQEEKDRPPFAIGKLESFDGRVRFDGEQRATTKRYKMLDTYTPAIGQRVLLARVKGSYVILGGIT